MKKNVILLALVLGGAVLMFLFIYPRFSQKDFSYGLDIYGGTVLIYEADLHNISPAEYSSAMNGLKDVIERRVNYSGIKEPRISVEKIGEHWRLRVELAGIKDVWSQSKGRTKSKINMIQACFNALKQLMETRISKNDVRAYQRMQIQNG